MIIERLIISLFAFISVLASTHGSANESVPDPMQTKWALGLLLEASGQNIPRGSSCAGNYGQDGDAKLRDMLSTQLAYLYTGENRIIGRCDTKNNRQCMLRITHSSGEDVSSAEIKFFTRNGKLMLNSLNCVITP